MGVSATSAFATLRDLKRGDKVSRSEQIGAGEGRQSHKLLTDRRSVTKSPARVNRPRAAIKSRPKRSVGSGVGRRVYVNANTLRHPKRPGKNTNKTFYRQPLHPQTLCHFLSSSASASKLWGLGKAKKENRATSSISDNSTGSVAVFNETVCSVSQSSIELKLIPSVSLKTFYVLFCAARPDGEPLGGPVLPRRT